jgi:hypothetical protein
MRDSATLSTLPVKLAHPEVLYWSAWVSFAYFAWRFWVLDPGSLGRFKEEWRRQAKASRAFHSLCLIWVGRGAAGKNAIEQIRANLATARPEFPSISAGVPVDFGVLETVSNGRPVRFLEARQVATQRTDLWRLRFAWTLGFVRAIFLERTASDLILPYVLGVFAVLSAVVAVATGHIPWRLN